MDFPDNLDDMDDVLESNPTDCIKTAEWNVPGTHKFDLPAATEPAPITRPVRGARYPEAHDRRPPCSQEAEEHVLAVCLLDEGATLARAIDAGLRPDSFFFPANRLVFEVLSALTPPSLETLVAELQTRRMLDQVGGMAYLMNVVSAVPTTAHAGYFIEKVRTISILRESIKAATRTVEEAYSFTGDIDGFLESAQRRLAGLAPAPKLTLAAKGITSYAYPSDDDPNIILGSDDYLGRGGGLLFVSHAGAGKSSWAMDACMMWALGRAWMQIKSHVPRKVLIIQAEDSDRYIGKIFTSFAYVNRLTEADLALLKTNCVIIRLKGVSGQAFFTALTQLTQEHQPDIVVINPIYLYAEGDITRSEFAQPFLLGLDAVNRAEKWAYILIHHTGKPVAKGNNGKRPELEDWESAYMGFGSSYLANWPRATILLEPVPGKPGHYQIKLGKGGLNAGVTKEVEQGVGTRQEPTTRIAIRHSTQRMPVHGRERPVYYWEMDDSVEETDGAPPAKQGRPATYHFSDFITIFPHADKPAMTRNQLFRFASDFSPIKETAFRDLLARAVQDGELVRIPDGTGFKYRLPL